MAFGALIVTLCGSCSFRMLAGVSVPSFQLSAAFPTLILVGIFGGIPIAVGVWMFQKGLRTYRK